MFNSEPGMSNISPDQTSLFVNKPLTDITEVINKTPVQRVISPYIDSHTYDDAITYLTWTKGPKLGKVFDVFTRPDNGKFILLPTFDQIKNQFEQKLKTIHDSKGRSELGPW